MISFIATRFPFPSPNLNNLLILGVLFAVSALTLRHREPSVPLAPAQTIQVRGVAIFLVVLGHLWTHVSSSKPSVNFAGDSVAVFLFLSGVGTMFSYVRKRPSLGSYVGGRVRRVMAPYWVTTVLFVSLDLIFLGHTLNWFDLSMTVLGVNMDQATRFFDYARWYITFQLFWYGLFMLAILRLAPKRAGWLLVLVAPILLILDYYVVHANWYNYLAFPCGCLLGAWYVEIVEWLRCHNGLVALATPALFGLYLSVKLLIAGGGFSGVPSLIQVFVAEGNALVLCGALLAGFLLLGTTGLYSCFLEFTGRYSYEIFLLHGPFLVKYNPFFALTTDFGVSIVVSFLLFLAFVMGLAVILRRALSYANL
jgi:peptidoglycan/LPS O-acetylase OafA/YrhL